MHWLADLMERRDNSVRIEAPNGEVLLRPSINGIQADYLRGPLFNGSATAYANSVKQVALDYAHQLQLPWSSGPDKTIQIKAPALYYEQTFRPDILAAETLLRWESRS